MNNLNSKSVTAKHSKRSNLFAVLFVLAFIVSAAVFWALKMIGISYTDPNDIFGAGEGSRGNVNDAIQTVDNNDYYGSVIKIDLFDYQAPDGGSNYGLNDYINNGHELKFTGNGGTASSNVYGINDYTGAAGNAGGNNDGHFALQGIVKPVLGDDGYPVLVTNDSSLGYLFPSDGTPGVQKDYVTPYYGTTGLFKENNGWLSFKSDDNYAYFDKVNNVFGVNSTTFKQESGQAIGFFPFNALNPNDKEVNGASGNSHYNHHFGMMMSADFYMYEKGEINGEVMSYKFSGDDDMWVFIDDVLVLDLGGIHDPVEGYIDFKGNEANGYKPYVTVSGAKQLGDTAGGTNAPTPITKTLEELYAAAGKSFSTTTGEKHTIKMFYLERGGVNSNLNIETNIFAKKTIDVKKVWDDSSVDEAVSHDNDKVYYKVYKVYKDANKPREEVSFIGTGATGVLSKDNNWSESVNHLAIPNMLFSDDELSSAEVDLDFYYEVVEVSTDVESGNNYASSVVSGRIEKNHESSTSGSGSSSSSTEATWQRVNGFDGDGIYVFVSDGYYYRFGGQWNAFQKGEAVNITDGLNVNAIPENARWYYENGKLQNVALAAMNENADGPYGGSISWLDNGDYNNQIWGYTTKDNARTFTYSNSNLICNNVGLNDSWTNWARSFDIYKLVEPQPVKPEAPEAPDASIYHEQAESDDNDYIITNTRIPAGRIDVSKAWKDVFGNPIDFVEEAEIELWQLKYVNEELVTDSDKFYASVVLTSNSDVKSFENLPLLDEEDASITYKYYLVEKGENAGKIIVNDTTYNVSYTLSDTSVTKTSPISGGVIKITNTSEEYESKDTSISVEKVWKNAAGTVIAAPKNVDISLYSIETQKTYDASMKLIKTEKLEATKVGTVTLNSDKLSHDFGALPLESFDSDSKVLSTYKYYAVEEGLVDGKIQVGEVYYDSSSTASSVSPVDSGMITVTNKEHLSHYLPPEADIVGDKTIDDLNRGSSNEHTDALDDDLYRLYLSLASLSDEGPVDLLVVVDQSGSMYETNDIQYENRPGSTALPDTTDYHNEYRDTVLSAIINGSAETVGNAKPGGNNYNRNDYKHVEAQVTESSLINRFLELNDDNQFMIIGFDGTRKNISADPNWNNGDPNFPYNANEGYTYLTDARKLTTEWTHNGLTGDGVNVEGRCFTGTNYEAGLLLAADMFKDAAVKDNGHRKVMIFFSDGVPTCFIRSEHEPDSVSNMYGNKNLGDRDGNTRSGFPDNEAYCVEPSKYAFDDFKEACPEVTVFSIGLSGELKESEEVLKYYAEEGHGGRFIEGNDGDKLKRDMEDLLIPRTPLEAVITDNLSAYVDIYKNPDYKVIMTAPDGTETVLYDGATGAKKTFRVYSGNGYVDRPIVKEVTYTKSTEANSTGTVKAVFDTEYLMVPNNTYSLSFNVKVNENAYKTYSDNDKQYFVTGDESTDYDASSITSSEKGGFYSNESARTDYKIRNSEGNKEEKYIEYDKPVVQISTDAVSIEKKWFDMEDNELTSPPETSIEVQIMQHKELYEASTPASGGGDAPDPSTVLGDHWVPVDELTVGRQYILLMEDNRLITDNTIWKGAKYTDYNVNLLSDNQYIWAYNSDGYLVNVGTNNYLGINSNDSNERALEIVPYNADKPRNATYENGYLKIADYYIMGRTDWPNVTSNQAEGKKFTLYEYYDVVPTPDTPSNPDGSLDPGEATPYGTHSVTSASDWKLSVINLPKYGVEDDGKFYKYTYSVEEVLPENSDIEVTYVDDGHGNFTINNKVPDKLTMELPMTGGETPLKYLLCGAVTMLLALLGYILVAWERRRHET